MTINYSKFITFFLVASLSFMSFILLTNEVNAQSETDQQKRQELLSKIINDNGKSIKNPMPGRNDPARPQSLPNSSKDPETNRLYEKALQDYYSYRSYGLQHRKAVFQWQLFSAKLIFIIVLGLVTCGVIFAAIQFRKGIKEQTLGKTNNDNLSTEMELTTKGIKINSPVLGVIILTISLAFFYLYLVYVYPIENVF